MSIVLLNQSLDVLTERTSRELKRKIIFEANALYLPLPI